MKQKPDRIRVVVDLDRDDAMALATIAARAPIAATRSAVIRACLRRGARLVLEDIAAGRAVDHDAPPRAA